MCRIQRNPIFFFLSLLGLVWFSSCKEGKPPQANQDISAWATVTQNPQRQLQTPIDPSETPPFLPPPDGFGSTGPEVRFGFSPIGVDRYRPLELVFSEPMNVGTVPSALTIRNLTTSTTITNYSLSWTSPVNLSIRFGIELAPNQEIEIEFATSARANANNTALLFFRRSFTTEKTIQVNRSLLVNGSQSYPVATNRGIVINQPTTTSLRLEGEVNFPTEVKEILLCKLGLTQSNHPQAVVCSSAVSTGVLICRDTCPSNFFHEVTSSAVIPPNVGTNLYYFRVETLGGNFYTFGIHFLYGNVAPSQTDSRNKVASLLLGQSMGINSVSGLITNFAKGNFSLFDTSSNSDKSLNEFVGKKTSTFPGAPCLAWPSTKLVNAPTPNKIDYLEKIGPFCGIEVTGTIFESASYPDVNYRAKADIYITNLVLDESSFPSGNPNLDFQFEVKNGILDINLYGKKARGKLAIVVRIEEIEFFDYLLANTLVFYGNSIPGTDGNEVGFALNEDPPTESARRAFARANLTVDSFGKANLIVSPFAFPNNFQQGIDCTSLPDPVPTAFVFQCNPFVTDWSNHIQVNAVTGTGAIAAIVADVVNKQIPTLKAKIVQNVLKDVAERVSPEILNNILGQLKSGIVVPLPDYLPSPLDKVSLRLNAQLEEDTVLKSSGSNFGLEGSLKASLLTCVKDSGNRCPWDLGYVRSTNPQSPYGSASYIISKSNTNTVLASNLSRASSSPGVLLNVHPDLVNQALYQLWWNGGFQFEIDQTFIQKINQFAGTSTLLRLTTSLLKADPIVTIFAPGQNNVTTSSGTIFPNDDVILSILPIQPIYVGVSPLSGSPSLEIPRINLSLADLEITLKAKKNDPSRPNCPGANCKDGSTYTIAKVRMSITSKATLDFGAYSLPTCEGGCTFSASILSSVGNPSLKLVTSSAVGDLYYLIEPLEGPSNNPMALRPQGIKEIVDPLVKSLIIPLLNNITRDIPLPKIRACGLDLFDLETLPIPGDSLEPYVLIHAKVQNILFTGSCRL